MLSRRWLINYALVILIAGLAFTGFNFDATRGKQAEQRISLLTPADINRIEIQADALRLELQRNADDWQITSPINWPAQTANVSRLLSILNLESAAVAEIADVDLEPLGLQPPVATWRLNDTQLLFGATNNIGERRYVILDSALFLLPDVHLAFAAQGLSGMVDRRLLPQRSDIETLQLPEVFIQRNDAGQWHSTDQPELTQAVLQQLITNWQQLSASSIRPFNLDAKPGKVIEFRFVGGQEIDFLLQSTEPEIVIANPKIGLQYHFRADFHDQLIAPRNDG